MFNPKKFMFVLMTLAIASTGIFMMPKTVAANALSTVEPLDLSVDACASGGSDYPEIVRLREDILETDNINEARALALAPTNDAIGALKDARVLMPFSDDLRLAETRINDARARIERAKTPDQVADEFSGMMLAGLDDDRAAHVDIGKAGCNYSTGEIIAIVIGLILGIIPGLILLVVLC